MNLISSSMCLVVVEQLGNKGTYVADISMDRDIYQ